MNPVIIFQVTVFVYIALCVLGIKNGLYKYKHYKLLYKGYRALCVVGLITSRICWVLQDDYPIYAPEYIQSSFLILVCSLGFGLLSYMYYSEIKDRGKD